MTTNQLFEKIKPFLIDDYNSVAYKSGMILEDYLELRMHEIECMELRFPGMSDYYLRKMNRFGIFTKVLGVSFIVLNLIKSHR